MITKQELLKKQKDLNIPLSTVEKDYILGLILSSFYRHPILKEQWVFKGGTCLKKIYIQNYRFSEDLDFTIKKDGTMNPVLIGEYLLEAFDRGRELLGLSIQNKNIKIDPFPDKKGFFIQIKVPYQSPLMPSGSLPRVKLDLTQDEVIEDGPTWNPLMHDYSDGGLVSIPIQSYSLDEIFAEKCRALIQRTRPRDLYDVVNIYETPIQQ
jgi:predicted nucleotidyltransferase component of viral defense system